MAGGRKVEIIKRDDTGPAPEVARRLAQELVVSGPGVDFLAGIIYLAERGRGRTDLRAVEDPVSGDERDPIKDHARRSVHGAVQPHAPAAVSAPLAK